MRKIKILIGLVLFVLMAACQTIYNYDLSYTITPGGESVNNALTLFIPESINAHKGRVSNDIEIIFQQLDSSQDMIADSLRNDLRPMVDTSVVFTLQVNALDPYDNETSRQYIRSFILTAW